MKKKEIRINKNTIKTFYYSLGINFVLLFIIEHFGEWRRSYDYVIFVTPFGQRINTSFYVNFFYKDRGAVFFYDYIDRAAIYFSAIFFNYLITYFLVLPFVFILVSFFRKYSFKIV